MYKINIGDFTVNGIVYHNRCLSAASIGGSGIESGTIPWEGTNHNPWDYKYENNTFVLDVIEIPPQPQPSDPMADVDEILLDHEERLILLEVGE